MNKLSVQFQTPTDWAGQVVTAGWVKLIEPPATNPFAAHVKVVGRVYLPDGEANALMAQGAAGADAWCARMLPVMLARPYVHAWEIGNEPQPLSDYGFCQQHAAFTRQAATRLRAVGLKSVGGNYAEGNPGAVTDTERANLFCATAAGLTACDYWGYHCYWVPDGYAHPEAGYNQWHARADKLMAGYAAARGLKLPPRLITECGIDGGIVGRVGAGWRSFVTWPAYVADLRRFAADLADEPDVLAAFIFVAGGNADWQSFDLGAPEVRELLALPVPDPAPIPDPAPAPTGALPGAPFLRWPLATGAVTQWFGEDKCDYSKYGLLHHNGIDIAARQGTNVYATHAGHAWVYDDPGYGRTVEVWAGGVQSQSPYKTIYAHNNEIVVAHLAPVQAGQLLARVGSTGNSTGPHCHFGLKWLWRNGRLARNPGYRDWVDPWPFVQGVTP